MKVSRLFLLLLCFKISVFNVCAEEDPKLSKVKDEQLPPCQACKMLVNSFKKAMESTNKKNYGGGDTAWEEEKLGDYRLSETRLIEVQEKVCGEVTRGQTQCYSLAEQWEELLEQWWRLQISEPDLAAWLCTDKAEACCPVNHFGPHCTPCQGAPDNVCSNNGKCKGAGTRKGNGGCICNEGYSGNFCDACAPTYYEAYRDDKMLLCSKCHPSCEGLCSQAGPRGCVKCATGWVMDSQKGCLDHNECVIDLPCSPTQFCVNNEGSYSCLACDAACAGCHGDGPDMCLDCAAGYSLQDGLCARTKAWLEDPDLTRYLTYLGLCVATCIIFQKNTLVASVIGLAVAVYVSLSEYMISTGWNKNTGNLESLIDTAKV